MGLGRLFGGGVPKPSFAQRAQDQIGSLQQVASLNGLGQAPTPGEGYKNQPKKRPAGTSQITSVGGFFSGGSSGKRFLTTGGPKNFLGGY